jgi:hypothetical protein
MSARHIVETRRNIEAIRATLAAELAKQEPAERVVNDALRSLIRLEVIPRLERVLTAEHAKAEPDKATIAAMTAEIQALHGGYLPDYIRDSLLASAR